MSYRSSKSIRGNSESEHASQKTPTLTSDTNLEDFPAEILSQRVLAEILRDPNQKLMPLITQMFPERDHAFYFRIKSSVLEIMNNIIGPLKRDAVSDPQPILQDRLSFCWKLLHQADVALWKIGEGDMNNHSDLSSARTVFRSLLNIPLEDSLLIEIMRRLKVEPDASYLYHYWYLIKKARKRAALPNPFSASHLNQDPQNLNRVIWWAIRSLKEQYVDVSDDEPVHIHLQYVIEKIIKDLQRWCGSAITSVPDLAGAVEGQLNEWLAYSHLDHPITDETPDADIDAAAQHELAKAFIKFNDLKTKLKIIKDRQSGQNTHVDAQIRKLEDTIRQLASENNSLEMQIKELKANQESLAETSKPALDQSLTHFDLGELADFLKLIDSKYSFDTLNSIQNGDETPLTFRSFIAHLFYCSRKKGFGQYPQEEFFNLTYDNSGLYQCQGFEIPPGGAVNVRVVKRGWALQSKGKLRPVKRAIVNKTD